MTHSIYDELTSLPPEATGLDVHKLLTQMGIAYVFDYAWTKHHPAGNFKQIVLYTVFTYSWETKMVRLGADWLKTKIRIAQKVELPQYLYDDVVHLQDQYLLDTFQDFLYLYRDNMDFIHLTSLKELYQQVMSQASRFNSDEAGNSDLVAKLKNIKHASEIKADIALQEAEVMAKYRLLQGARSDFKYDNVEHGNPLKIENSALIRG